MFLFIYFRNPGRFRDPTGLVDSEFVIEGVTLHCSCCDHSVLSSARTKLNTTISTFLSIDQANYEAEFFCERCGFIHRFKRDYDHIQKWRQATAVHNQSPQIDT
jgi:hypothetical protein